MDKSWIDIKNKMDPVYLTGVANFIEFAYANKDHKSKIYCPCKQCANLRYDTRNVVLGHLLENGFLSQYKRWTLHGESFPNVVASFDSNTDDDMVRLVHDAFRTPGLDHEFTENVRQESTSSGPDVETKNFFKLLEDAERELYPGCDSFTTLSFLVQLMHIKVLNGWSDKSFDMLVELLKKAFPKGETLPKSYYDAKKFNEALGFTYKKIDACPRDCMLYWKDKENLDKCDHCHRSRYKVRKGNSDDELPIITNIPAKQVRYFPLKPRLQKLFMSRKTAFQMRWHAEERTNDGKIRHPADSLAWKDFDEKHQKFASDHRSVRLGLASDGFSPFKSLTNPHSTWPVVLMPYNLPPWLCMKQPFFMLSLLIDGPRSPGNDIDVFLQPLIEELEDLWTNGSLTYDAVSDEMFSMRVALMWTISDFPAYANLSGWSTKGALACPCCNKDTFSRWLKHGRKFCYMGHRKFLEGGHYFRNDKKGFDGSIEVGLAPPQLSGDDIFKQVVLIKNKFGKTEKKNPTQRKRKRANDYEERDENNDDTIPKFNWKKKSIFFDLPYWKDNLIRHNLDVMHIEKNVCENLIVTLLNIKGKSKDNLKARYDLQDMGIRKKYHPQQHNNGKVTLPPAEYTMNKDKIGIFLNVLKSVKGPDGYSSNIPRRVNLEERIISGFKSHDFHILMEHLLPLAVRKVLPDNVIRALIELSNFFRKLCSKVLDVKEIEQLEKQITLTLCRLEKIFPPGFFNIMEHLPIHLAYEAKIAGPVHYRWMYPIERFLLTLKNYVRNRRHPEGSIAEGYLAEECLTFCSRYLLDVETKLNRPLRNEEGKQGGSLSRKGKLFLLDDITWEQAHRYILSNSNDVSPLIEKHIKMIKRENRRASERDIWKKHNEKFPDWLKYHVLNLQQTSNDNLSDEVKLLAAQPDKWARRYNSYTVNGLKFRTKKREERLTTQNSGVLLTAKTNSFSSSRDNRPVLGDVDFYGILTDIIELRYSNELKFLLFRCDWVDNNVGAKKDEFGYTLVNFKHLLYKHNRPSDEPFMLASQAKQVWYIQDPIEKDWLLVMKMFPRDVYDLFAGEDEENFSTCQQVEPDNVQQFNDVTPNSEDDDIRAIPNEDGILIDEDDEDEYEIGDAQDDEDDDAYFSEDYYYSEDDDMVDSVCDDEDTDDSSSDNMDEDDT